jgi:hypothetical protein
MSCHFARGTWGDSRRRMRSAAGKTVESRIEHRTVLLWLLDAKPLGIHHHECFPYLTVAYGEAIDTVQPGVWRSHRRA